MKKLIIAAACAALMTLGGCGIAGQSFVTTAATEDPAANYPEAPNLVGKTVDQIEAIKERYPFVISFDYRYDNAEKDTVIDQSLTAGEKYSEGEELVLTVSSGLKPIEIDDYTGRNIDDAQTLIEKQGLICEIVRQESDSVPVNCVIRTKPEARQMAEPGSTVVCYVSMGSGNVGIVMPKLVGLTVEEAYELAERSGVGLNVSYEDSADAAPGTVISQAVEEGEEMEPDQLVEIVVAGEASAASGKTTISVTVKTKREGEFQLKYYIDGTLQEDKTEIKEISLTKKIVWEVSGSDEHTYSILVTSLKTGKSDYLYKITVDYSQDPPLQTPEEEFNSKIFEKLLSED